MFTKKYFQISSCLQHIQEVSLALNYYNSKKGSKIRYLLYLYNTLELFFFEASFKQFFMPFSTGNAYIL